MAESIRDELGTLFNSTSALIPSPMDFLFAFPRLAQKASSLALFYLPEQFDNLLSKATSNRSISQLATPTSLAASILSSAVGADTKPLETGQPGILPSFNQGWLSSFGQSTMYYRISNLDGVFSYLASRWAISTFAIAITLNRTQVYASSRRHLNLNWQARLWLRILPVAIFIYQILVILQTMRCQTSSQLSQARIRDSEQVLFGAFTGEGGPLYRLSSALLFWQDDEASCLSAGMSPATDDFMDFSGSLAILWPLFLSLCLSHFVENLSCALQGRQPMAETGMTIFEHSLAFAEAEAVVRSSAGMGLFGLPNTTGASTASPSSAPTADSSDLLIKVTRAMIMERLNVPPEVLLIALVSSCSHLSSNILAIFGLQARFRLVNTGIWGVSFMSAVLWSFVKFSRSVNGQDISVLRYPTVCIVGFMPHLLILVGITLCTAIYGLALCLTILSPPSKHHSQGSFLERLRRAHNNLQANVSLSNIKISWQEEFYTTLLKIGFTIMTAASEAIYFNEGTTVTMARWTWLEAQRYQELKRAALDRMQSVIPPELLGDSSVAEGVGLIEEDGLILKDGQPQLSGYARERKTTKSSTKAGAAAMNEEGVGGSQRSGRWIMSWNFIRAIASLVVRFSATLVAKGLAKIGIRKHPSWLKHLGMSNSTDHNKQGTRKRKGHQSQSVDFWMLSDNGDVSKPVSLNVDVEVETRKRLHLSEDPHIRTDEFVDSHLYEWWKTGGWWGELDSSGDYKNAETEDDLTSVISEATATSANASDDSWADEESGTRTPTQSEPGMRMLEDYDSDISDDDQLTRSHLVALLDPKTLEHKHEAKLLASHIQSPTPLTRAQYRTKADFERARILLPANALRAQPLTPQEEEDMLEQIILTRRDDAASRLDDNVNGSGPGRWDEGAEGMGSAGPQCVVCHSSPRTILVWPCRCLSLCEECRVSLAMNNFGSCVCCRRDVVAFSRLYVP